MYNDGMKRAFIVVLLGILLPTVGWGAPTLKSVLRPMPSPAEPASACVGKIGSSPDVEQFIRQYVGCLIEAFPSDDTAALAALASQLADGSWADVNYAARDRTRWPPARHLERLEAVARCFADRKSSLYRSARAEAAIGRGLDAWYKKHPVSDNWWRNQIYSPRHIGNILLLLRDAGGRISPRIFADTIQRWAKEGGSCKPHWTGSNLINIAAHRFVRGVLTGDRHLMDSAAEAMMRPLKISSGEGLQEDWSYHQHGPQLYIANYGQEWLNLYAFWLNCFRGTPYAAGAHTDLVVGYALNTFFSAIRGRHLIYNARGRQQAVGHQGEQGETKAILPILKNLARIAPGQASVFESIAKRVTSGAAREGYTPMSTYYYRSDYLLHVRPTFTYDYRTASVRTERTEWCNHENLLGHWMTEGASGYYRTGEEYFNIAALWDWHKIPGTTLVDRKADSEIPRYASGGIPGSETFVGGIGADGCSVAAYVRRQSDMPAKEARFAFGDAIFALGTSLASNEKHFPLVTTVNQCWRSGDILPDHVLKSGRLITPATLTHGGFRYTFPGKGIVHIASDKRSGPWSRVCKAATESESGEVFTLWFDHGVAPKNASYAYIVTPVEAAASKAELINTPDVQAVADPATKSVGAVFHTSGKRITLRGHTYSVSAPCVLLRTASGLRVADPEHRLSSLTIAIDGQAVDVKLPRGPHAGKAVAVIL